MSFGQDGKSAIDKAKVEVVRTLLVDATNAFEVRTPSLPSLHHAVQYSVQLKKSTVAKITLPSFYSCLSIS